MKALALFTIVFATFPALASGPTLDPHGYFTDGVETQDIYRNTVTELQNPYFQVFLGSTNDYAFSLEVTNRSGNPQNMSAALVSGASVAVNDAFGSRNFLITTVADSKIVVQDANYQVEIVEIGTMEGLAIAVATLSYARALDTDITLLGPLTASFGGGAMTVDPSTNDFSGVIPSFGGDIPDLKPCYDCLEAAVKGGGDWEEICRNEPQMAGPIDFSWGIPGISTSADDFEFGGSLEDSDGNTGRRKSCFSKLNQGIWSRWGYCMNYICP